MVPGRSVQEVPSVELRIWKTGYGTKSIVGLAADGESKAQRHSRTIDCDTVPN